jgi:hypothetical protein
MPRLFFVLLVGTALALPAAPPRGPRKGDLKREFERVSKPPKKNKFEKPEHNYDPPKPKGPGGSGSKPKPPGPR